MTPAARLTNEIRAAVSKHGARLFNTHVGKFWAGHSARRFTKTETVTVRAGDVLIRNGRMVNVGFPGLSDLIGGSPMKITPEDVGKTVFVATVIEVKAGNDRPRSGQPEFIAAVQRMGGRGGFARSVGEAVSIVSPPR